MKKLVLFFSLIVSTASFSQLWFDVGVKGGGGIGFPINNTLNNDGRFGVAPGYSWFGGGKIGINWGHFVGLTCDFDYAGYSYKFTQAEVPGKSQTEAFDFRMSYNSFNVMPMFRFTKESSFLEIGPQFQFVRNQNIEDEAFPASSPSGAEYISGRLTGLTFGFGAHIMGNEIISLMAGLRLNYVLSDLTAESYRDSSFPFGNYNSSTNPITEHTKISPINAQIVLEVNYSLGYIAKSTSGCGRRAAFLTF